MKLGYRWSALVLVIACHAQTRSQSRQPPEERAAAAIVRWGVALQRGDDQALEVAEDRSGQGAIIYTAVKAAASHVDGGPDVLESTIAANLFVIGLQTFWPGIFGAPFQTWFAIVPTGPLGPALIEAGLATQGRPGEPTFAIVPVPWDDTLGRLEKAIAAHRAKLREKEVWACRFAALEYTVLPTELSLLRAAQISTHTFASWLHDIDGVWIVRARCPSGPALFAITGYRSEAKILFAAI